jgi:hypothetical protein
MLSRQKINHHPKDSFEYVYLHGKRQLSRGKNPSATTQWARDPKKSFTTARRFAYFSIHETYLEGKIPTDYKCVECGSNDSKLWREFQTFGPKLLCASCAAKDQGKDISDIDHNGKHTCKELGIRSDSIGWYVPAIPTEELDGYWGYTSVPRIGCEWWYKLPTPPANKVPEPTQE